MKSTIIISRPREESLDQFFTKSIQPFSRNYRHIVHLKRDDHLSRIKNMYLRPVFELDDIQREDNRIRESKSRGDIVRQNLHRLDR